jgi:hypothetical protein
MSSEVIDWTAVMDGAAWFHVTGITPALSERTAGAQCCGTRCQVLDDRRLRSIDPTEKSRQKKASGGGNGSMARACPRG